MRGDVDYIPGSLRAVFGHTMDLPTTAAGASAPPRSPASPSSLAPLSFADYVRLINMGRDPRVINLTFKPFKLRI